MLCEARNSDEVDNLVQQIHFIRLYCNKVCGSFASVAGDFIFSVYFPSSLIVGEDVPGISTLLIQG